METSLNKHVISMEITVAVTRGHGTLSHDSNLCSHILKGCYTFHEDFQPIPLTGDFEEERYQILKHPLNMTIHSPSKNHGSAKHVGEQILQDCWLDKSYCIINLLGYCTFIHQLKESIITMNP